MKSPFKFLDSYTKDDREIFFGREREIEELYHRVFESKIMLVYGISGTGKSSLIHCGLANKFQDTDWLPIMIRRGENLVESMASGIKSASLTHTQNKLESPADFRKGVRSLYLDNYKPIYFIFDQFEELFIFGTKEEDESFTGILRSILSSDLQCKFIFILREEYLGWLSTFEKSIPGFFNNRIRVEKMDIGNARSAIEGPCRKFGISVGEGFADSMLQKLCPPKESEIELTYLQVYLDKIFKLALAESKDISKITFQIADLDKAGNVSDILGNFLDEQISLLPDPETALTVLKAFVSARGTKRPASAEEVREYALSSGKDIDENNINSLLNSLVNLRILQDKDSNSRHELKHDALASKIYEKITLVEKELLEIRQLIENAFHDYQKRGVLLSEEDLKYIAPYESRLYLPESHKKLIEKSKSELLKTKHRRRNVFSAAGVLLIIVLSGFSIWAVKERKNALGKEKIATEERIKAENSEQEAIRARDMAIESDKKAIASEKEAIAARDRAEASEMRTIKEKELAIRRETEARANNFNYLSREISSDDPTLALQLADHAHNLDPDNKAIMNNMNSIYNDYIFYKVFFRYKTGELCRISPDWKTIAVTKECSAELTDISGRNPRSIIGHRIFALVVEEMHLSTNSIYNNILSLSFSPDGRLIVTGSNDRTARLWDIDGNMLHVLRGHSGYIRAVAFSPDGKKIVTGSNDFTARIWDNQGNCLKVFRGHNSEIYSAVFSPDGNSLLAGLSDSTAILWDLEGNILQRFRGHENIVRCVAFSNDGKTLLTASDDKSARLWDLNANLLQVFNGHSDNILSIAFSPDEKTILTGAADRTARLWDLNGNTIIVLRGHGGNVNSVVFNPDGVSALTFSTDGVARKWDISQGKFKDLTGIKSAVTCIQFSPDGKSIMTVSGTPDPSLKIWDTDGNYRQTFRYLANTAAFSPDGNNILIGGLGAQLLSPEGKILKTFTGHIMDVISVAFSPDGKTIITGGVDKTARIWDLSGKIKIILTGHSDAVSAIAFSPDNKTILTGSYDKTARLWDIEGNLLRVFNGHTDAINSACFSPDGKIILTASDDNTSRLWDLTGKCIQVFSGHTRWVTSTAFSPDGERIITGSSDNTARVWDLEGNTIQVVKGFNKSVTSVAFSPDGKKALIGSEDNIARLVELKKPVGVFLNEGLSEKISTEQAVKYEILQPDQLESENDMSKLFGGIIFCLSEAKTQINKKEIYLNTASVLLRKTAKGISDADYRKKFISCGMELYKHRPQKFIADKVEEANKNALTSSAVVDLRNSYQFYSDKCSTLDSVSISMNLPEVLIQIAEKLSEADTAARKNISFDMAALAWSLVQNRKHKTAMDAIGISLKTNSSNQFAIMILPLVLVLNDHYIEARDAYLKYYRSYAFNPVYGSYKMIYLKDIDELERRGITHSDFEKIKELLKQ